MEKIIFKNKVLDYFDELVYTLFKEEYFSYSENAQLYVDKIIDFIILEINCFPNKITSYKLQYLGSNYIFYNANGRTTWCIFSKNRKINF